MVGYGQRSERITSTASSIKKIEDDLKKLYKCGQYKVFLDDENIYAMSIQFKGPKDTPYANGYWRLNVEVSNEYPFKSPSVGFANRIYHPNVDFESGTICLDVLNSRWTPMYGLKDIVEWMIPGLLKEPNASDPLNSAAARLKASDEEGYERKVRQYVIEYASKAAYNKKFYSNGICDDTEDHLYYVSEAEDDEDEVDTSKAGMNGVGESKVSKNKLTENKVSENKMDTNNISNNKVNGKVKGVNGSHNSTIIDQKLTTTNGTNKTVTKTTISVTNSNGYSALLEKTMHTLSDSVNKLDHQYHHQQQHFISNSVGKDFHMDAQCDSSDDYDSYNDYNGGYDDDDDDDDDDALSDIDISDTDLMECES